MRKCKTTDGYQVYRIRKDKKIYFLADRMHYKENIEKMLLTFEGLRYDSIVILFGFDTGSYLKNLNTILCVKNKVIIIEPNKRIYKKYVSKLPNNMEMILFEETRIKEKLFSLIHYKNINNIYFFSFGNYSKIYQKEYDYFVEHLDWTMINVSSLIGLAKRFKTVFLQNLLANIKILNQTSLIYSYAFSNVDVPAIIVSGGPSLDQNIQDLKKHPEKMKQSLIIASSRTIGSLTKNNILPDLIVTVDPVDANYDMMKEYLDLKVPLAFYEYSNRYLVGNYKGDKLFITLLLAHTMEEFKKYRPIFCGGSVAHACVDIANMLGCSPIILIGQDLAHTNSMHHAKSASYAYDETHNNDAQIYVKDVFGNMVGTTITLDYYKKRLEEYIDLYKENKRLSFINCSYGADIKGAPHQELEDVLIDLDIQHKKKELVAGKHNCIATSEVLESILSFIKESLEKAEDGYQICQTIVKQGKNKSLIDVEDEDIDLQRMLYLIKIVNEFENAPNHEYLGGYFSLFAFEMKDKVFIGKAKDYEKQTSDLLYQANLFLIYFSKMKEMLEEVNQLVKQTVAEFYE